MAAQVRQRLLRAQRRQRSLPRPPRRSRGRDSRRQAWMTSRQPTPAGFCRALARVALQLPAVPTAVEAMAIARQKPDLGPTVRNRVWLLFHQGEGFLARTLTRRGWVADRPVAVEVKTFWSAVLGARLISDSGFGGRSSDVDLAGVLTIRQHGPRTS
jgi:TetR/AcrR family transcriptional regulator, regulator of cefoperazone and chloramphenicol sensitivity